MKLKYTTKVVPLELWEMPDYQERMMAEGWRPYGYEPLPFPSIVNLVKEVVVEKVTGGKSA